MAVLAPPAGIVPRSHSTGSPESHSLDRPKMKGQSPPNADSARSNTDCGKRTSSATMRSKGELFSTTNSSMTVSLVIAGSKSP